MTPVTWQEFLLSMNEYIDAKIENKINHELGRWCGDSIMREETAKGFFEDVLRKMGVQNANG